MNGVAHTEATRLANFYYLYSPTPFLRLPPLLLALLPTGKEQHTQCIFD